MPRRVRAGAKAAQPGPDVFTVELLVAPEAPEQCLVGAISYQNTEANRFGVVMDQVVFEGEIEPEQSD